MEKVEKTWGYEHCFVNTKDYCGKLLVVEPGKWSSEGKFHFHNVKDETFFVFQGILCLDIANVRGEYLRLFLYENDSYRVMPGVKHRFSSATEIPCKFIEASTHHDDADSYRCYFDNEKGEWKNVE
jgi:mannose-6-phosphate isomerase-like protein (cupin superfamily)